MSAPSIRSPGPDGEISDELRETVVTVSAKDLPLFCPRPGAPLWSQHPRVFLDIADSGEVLCPYCSTRYVLAGGPMKGGH